jgi:gliding motility associated protien GldN
MNPFSKTAVLYLILMVALFPSKVVFSQSNVLDGVYVKEHIAERKVIPYAHLREADVMWSKRVWRTIDLKEKLNHDLYYPETPQNGRKSLMQVIWDGVTKDGIITAYEDVLGGASGDFEQAAVLPKAAIDTMFNKIQRTSVPNPDNPDELIETEVPIPFLPSMVKSYKIKEDWFFDKQRSVMDVRIIGIAPVIEKEQDDGTKAQQIMFWIYYPEIRFTLVGAEVYNKFNDSERRSYEDIFWKRKFSSYIYKESNVFDRKITEYAKGLAALLEAERIKDEMRNFEHDLWEY